MKTANRHPAHQALIDPYGRKIEYVRLSLTDKCNLRCFYCMPKGFRDFEQPAHWLTEEEIVRVIRAFTTLGVSRVRLTGGEPLVRREIVSIATRLTALPGLDDLSLSTNAVLLARHADALFQAGVKRINVSLDSLDETRFKQITGGNLSTVIDGLMAARKTGFNPVKINMVAMKGVNDDEFEPMVAFCLRHGFTLRFIEAMPMGQTRDQTDRHYLSLQTVRQRLERRYKLIPGVMPGGGPARYMQVEGTPLRIGFITPISQHFCETCNRVRLSVDGTLYLCLGQDDKLALRPLLRDGIDDHELQQVILEAIARKPQKHEFTDKPEQVVRLMSMTGG